MTGDMRPEESVPTGVQDNPSPVSGGEFPGQRRRLVATILVTLGAWIIFDLWCTQIYQNYRIAELHSHTAAIGASLTNSLGSMLNQRLSLVRGLAAFATVKADDPPEASRRQLAAEFPDFAKAMATAVPGIRNQSISPQMIVGYVYPMDGDNAKVLGNDLMADKRPGFARAMQRAISTRALVLHDPVDLIQGGRGLIARQVIYVNDAPWGAVGMVFDLSPLLSGAGLGALPGMTWAVRSSTGGDIGGDQQIFDADPWISRIDIPGGYWELAIMPADGWAAAARQGAEPIFLQLALVLLGLMAVPLVTLTIRNRYRLAYLIDARTRELLETQAHLNQQKSELARANSELERFAYVAAHDLQEPLRGIACFSQLAMRSPHGGASEDPEIVEWLTEVVKSATRMKGLLHDIQLYLAEAKLPLPTTPLPAEKALETARNRLANRINASDDIDIEVFDPLPVVMADHRRLTEIFQIMLSNAIEYRAKDKPLQIRIRGRRGDIFDTLEVEDNGIGIEPQFHERIFEVFQRLHSRSVHPGTGMGLAIARKMAERLSGRISVVSQTGCGSTFILELPTATHFVRNAEEIPFGSEDTKP